jgi:hypothetical protein
MNDGRMRSTNWKLIGGIALLAGLGVLLVGQNGGWSLASALPLLLILACPLMMICMMGHHMAGPEQHHEAKAEDLPDLAGLPHDQQVATLRHELTRMAWRQESLRQTLEQVEADQRAGRVVDAAPANNQR